MKFAFTLFLFSFYEETPYYPKLKEFTIEEAKDLDIDINPFSLFKTVLYKHYEHTTCRTDIIKTTDVLSLIKTEIHTMNAKRLKTFMMDEGFDYAHSKKGSFFEFIKRRPKESEECEF